MARDPMARAVSGVPGGVAALRAMAEAVGQLIDWPTGDDDEDGRQFASLVLHDAAGTVRRKRRAVPLSATVLVFMVVHHAADEAGIDRRELWRRVAQRIDRLLAER